MLGYCVLYTVCQLLYVCRNTERRLHVSTNAAIVTRCVGI